MEALIDFLNNYLSDETLLRRTIVLVVGLTIFVLGIGVSVIVLGLTNPIRKRLGLINESDAEERGDTLSVKVATAIGPVASYVLPKSEMDRSKVKSDLIRAGIRSPQGFQVYFAAKTLLAICLPIIVIFSGNAFPTASTESILFYALASAGVGLLIPNYFLDKMVNKRTKLLRNGFPDALDLLVVCVESGLGLGPALQRVADELEVSHPDLSFELSTVNAEIRAGVPRERALKNLATRTGLQDINGLVGLLVQSMRFGTSVADALRIYSEEFRDKRMQAAEEQAAKMGTKLIFPLVLCLFPVFFVVAIGPAVLRIIDAFSAIGGN